MVRSVDIKSEESFEELKKEVISLSKVLETLDEEKKRVVLAMLKGMVLALES